MSWRTITNMEKTYQIIHHLIEKKRNIKVKFKDDNTDFTTKIVAFNQSRSLSDTWKGSVMIIGKMLPEKGSSLIQSTKKASLEFMVNDSSIRCSVDYMGISSTPPHFGFIVSIPKSLDIEDKRSNERHTYELPDFVSAEFTINKGTSEEKTYELDVLDCSRHGLGLVIDQNNIDLIQKIKTGTVIKEITFYATWAMIKVTGIVQHITKIEEGKYKNGYLLGIESRDIIESCKQRNN